MESKNLLINKTCFDDYLYFSRWEKQADVIEFISIEENVTYEDIVKEGILCDLDPAKRQFTIFLKGKDVPIGRIVISRISPEYDSLDITRIYIGDAEHRGHGYGEEAMRLVLEYCFMNLHTERVTIDHYTGNKPAAELYLKLGFQYEGVARNACKKNGKYYDLNIMSMLRAEYYEKAHTK